MTVTVYTVPNCSSCEAVKRFLGSRGVPFTEKNVREDPAALAELRKAVLAPFAQVAEGTAERLMETLRAWLLLQGRRELVAESLHVHPQTVRYRMNQVRDLYGERLNDPDEVLALVLALGR